MQTVVNKKRIVKFAPKGQESFHDAIKRRVDEYFTSNNLSQHANIHMRIKTAIMVSLYFIPFIVISAGLTANMPWLFYSLWVVMSVGIVGIGVAVMHDANHGAYSTNNTVNSMLGKLLNLVGGYAPNWKIQHNILHHTYTNLDGLDEDIAGTVLIRMCPHKPLMRMHRYQHIYAWGLYALMNIMWIFVKDFKVAFRYHKNDLLRKEKLTLRSALTEIIVIKLLYFVCTLGLPLMFSGMSVGAVLTGFFIMHIITGLSLALIFQPAHVMETSEFPKPSDDMKMENNWAVHQLLNTTNFAPKSKLATWFMGGLNYQIEHHLFPQVCHVHYPQISGIIEDTAKEYNLPYNSLPTVWKAVVEHGRMLHILGTEGRYKAAYPSPINN